MNLPPRMYALSLCLLCSPVVAADTAPSAAVGGAASRAYIDPQTKQLAAPPDAETTDRRTLRIRPPDFSRVQTETLADGTVVVQLNGQFRMMSMVERKADGTFALRCLPSAQPVQKTP